MTLSSPNRGFPLERLEGSTGSMGYWNGLFTRVATALGDLRTAAQTASDLEGVGAAVTAARADAEELRGVLAADIAEAELLAGVLQRYSDAFSTSAERANGMIEDIEDAHAAWVRLAGTAENAGLEALWTSRSGEDDEVSAANEAARDAIAERDGAQAELDTLWEEYEGYYGAWDEAYDAALSELAAGTNTVLTADARDLLDDLLAADPAEVMRLWEEHPELHSELISQHPEIIGNLDGIPYSTRAEVNRQRLEDLYESDPGGELGDQIDALWNELGTGPPPPNLISFDPDGSAQVTAAFAYGDLDAATDISLLIPGMNSDVNGIGEWGTSARALNSAGPGLATIVWFGYDSPTVPEEPFMDRAHDGAASLRQFLLGLDALHPAAETAVIAHSYGSTTAALAIGSQPDGLGVDQFIAVGSAGFPSDPQVLANLQSGEGPQMFATLSEDDLWARIGRDTSWLGEHGTVPETLDGVVEFGSDGGYDAEGNPVGATPGHGAHHGGNSLGTPDADDGYLMEGSESFYNIQQIIVTGEPGTEMDGEGSERGFWDLPDWLPVDPYRL